MINEQLLHPKSIVVVGGSDNVASPGGKTLKNLIDNNFSGDLYVVNPKKDNVQRQTTFKSPAELPQVDLAIIAIAARFIPETVEILTKEKGTKAFIIPSAGFSEENEEGAKLEQQIVDKINEVDGALIGPNCIGVLNQNYAGVFTTPIPKLDAEGVDFISGSGATAVFIMEAGVPNGVKFSSVYSVGNSAQIGVEEVLEYMDENFDPTKDSKIKLLYIESIDKPQKLLKHASSLIQKGCKIAAVKSGSSDAGSRAASSHTGALANSDVAVDALFHKAGIVRCHSREELIAIASVFSYPELKGNNIAIITHAGGPAVMLTDALSNNGMEIPHLESPELLEKLFPGSSVANPIDFLATGTAEQLGEIIDHVENKFDEIDGMAVIFGSPGLFEVYDVYKLLYEKMQVCKKPIYPILPSVINVKKEIDYFISLGGINFPDEVVFGRALSKVFHTEKPKINLDELPKTDTKKIRSIIEANEDGYLKPEDIQALLDAAGINRAKEGTSDKLKEAKALASEIGYPLVMKVVGPVHKSDVGGVVLNVKEETQMAEEFERMMQIPETTAILMQPMLSGTELFVGAKAEPKFGHTILCGLGGIFIEVLKDVAAGIAPVRKEEAKKMIQSLKSYKIIEGVRGQAGVNQELFAETIVQLSALLNAAPEIVELDLNPLLGTPDQVVAVDARIRIEK